MRIEYHGRDAYMYFDCKRSECGGEVRFWATNAAGEYSDLTADCEECGADHELNAAISDDDGGEFTDPSESGLRSGKGTGLLRRLFRED